MLLGPRYIYFFIFGIGPTPEPPGMQPPLPTNMRSWILRIRYRETVINERVLLFGFNNNVK